MVVDANVFSSVFKPDTLGHPEFKPVLDWVISGPGFLVYGGSKYDVELSACLKTQP
jgi:hypothetical protein